MNLFELGFASLTVGGGVVGAMIGYPIYGIAGAVLGAIAGAATGLASAYALVFLLAVVCKLAFGGPLFKPRKPPGLG
jgi:hypothetical protein